MLKMSHSSLLFISGFVWLLVGCFLLPLGLNFVVGTLLKENIGNHYPVLHFLSDYVGGLESAALCWIGIALVLGMIKGRSVFAKSVQRSVNRIQTLPNPVSLGKIYTPAYYALLGSMVLLGFVVRFAPMDVRGGVDIAIGCALINGALLYFRQAWSVRRLMPKS